MTSKSRIKWIIILLASLILGLCLISRAKTFAYQRASKGILTSEAAILPAYAESVEQKRDAQTLGTIGQNLLEKNMPLFASVNFKQAAQLDPNSRDAAYGWAYSLAKAHGDNISQETMTEIKEALDKVEAIDPHYIPALKLAQQVATLQGDQAQFQSLTQRLELLEK
jgi:cytochrome c-type biogenesis protein CcmH/NrfG